jgi:putative DNA primase/helicase
MTTDTPVAQNGHAPDAGQRVLDALGNEFTDESLRKLAEGAIPLDRAVGFGVRSVRHPDHVPEEIHRFWVVGEGRGPGMLFPWNDLDRTVFQFRPDVPVRDEDGAEHKYIFPKDCGAVLNHLRQAQEAEPVLLVEGTKQSLSAAVWAPEGWGIVGMSGCWGWRGADLGWCEDRKVMILMDQDVHTNRDVHNAASGCKEALEAEGADEVVFVKLPGAASKDGLDDVLGRRAQDRRTSYLERICRMGEGKLGRAPARQGASPYMGDKGLLARTAALAVLEGQPAALAAGSMIALYRDGAFRIDREREPLIEKVKDMLGEDYRPNWRATVEEYLVGELYGRGLRLPDKMSEPLLNCANGMLDLKTGELLDWDPSYLSSLQIPVKWDPKATCPVYEQWLLDVIPDQYEALEEIASMMLDPSRTPQKALFGFGPSRSGKSTFLRIMAAIAGVGNTSAVTLHQLADNKFMAANIYGKMLNVAADLSAAHVEDTSLFKMLTGEDPVAADRKYGKTFQFTNRALFAFSANDIPTVSETSRAYVQRIAPFRFSRSFAGAEKPEIEEKILRDELPGVLVRWVGRWRAFSERGAYLPPAPDVAEEFEAKSDRVARWAATRCDVHPEAVGLVGAEAGSLVTELYNAFKLWTKDDGGAQAMTRPKFGERLRSVPGVHEVRLKHKNKNLGLNVTTHTGPDREIGRKGTPEAIPGDNDTEKVWEGVGSVGSRGSSTYVGTESEMIKEEKSQAYVKEPAEPTLPTPTHTLVNDLQEGSDGRQTDHNGGVHGTGGDQAGSVGALPHREERRGSAAGTGSDPAIHSDQETFGTGIRPDGAVPGGGPGAGVPGDSSVEEYGPDPFAPAPPVLNGPVAFDLETPSAKELFTFRSGEQTPYARLNGVLDGDGKEIITTDPAELVRLLTAAPALYAHNGYRFDLMALAWHHGADYDALAAKTWDTYVDATVVDPPGAKGQKPWATEGYYGLDQVAARNGLPGKTDHLPALAREFAPEGLAGKAAEEAGYGRIQVRDGRYRAYLSGDLKAQSAVTASLLADPDRMEYRRREQRVAHIQNRMTLSGWKVDVSLLAERVQEEADKVRESLGWLNENCGIPLTKSVGTGRGKNRTFRDEPVLSPLTTTAGREAVKAAFRARGLPYFLETESGALALNKDALGEGSYMVGKGAAGKLLPGLLNPARMARLPEADWEAIAEMAGHIRLVTTAVQKYQEIQGFLIGDRVHAHVGETQGSRRWAMVKPSITNLGKRGGKVVQRAPFIADEGCVLIAFDFDQVDMRAFAGHCGDPDYIGMFERREDPHSMIADMVFGRHDGEWRERAKAAGHGYNYGLSVNGMVNSGIDRVLAEQFHAGMSRSYPVMDAWRTEVRARAADGQLLENGFGALLRCDPARAYTQAPAQIGQGTARDIMCEGLLRLPQEYIPWLRGVVHDEAVLNVPEGRVQECIEVVTAAFTMDLAEITNGRLHSVPIVAGASRPARSWDGCYQKD